MIWDNPVLCDKKIVSRSVWASEYYAVMNSIAGYLRLIKLPLFITPMSIHINSLILMNNYLKILSNQINHYKNQTLLCLREVRGKEPINFP